MLRVDRLTVRYGAVPAVCDVDLAVGDAEVVCVLGPSGSGKSTLLRAIGGLEPLAAGRVGWDGADLDGVPPHRRGFGLMFQDHALFPHRDVLANVAFGLRMQHLPRAAVDARARQVLALVGLVGFEHRHVHELSGGEQQRVALARALAPSPRLLMLDEPLGALDRNLRERLVNELRTLFRDLELSVLFVTHDHDEAFGLADRLVVMRSGTVVQDAPPTEVWRRPADAFVARFLGWNVTDAFGDGRLAVPPEGVRLVDGDGVAGVVAGRVFRRDHYLLTLALEGHEPVQAAVAADGAEPPDVGDRVCVGIDPAVAVSVE
jgi:thiamine transport system ATP-binding protein